MTKAERVIKFIGDGSSTDSRAGGLTLPALFGPAIVRLFDYGHGNVGDIKAEVIAHYPGSGGTRVFAVFGSWEHCLTEVYNQLIDRGYAYYNTASKRWYRTEKLVPGRIEVITAEEGQSIGVMLEDRAARERHEQEDIRRNRIEDWLFDMQASSPGTGFKKIPEQRLRLARSIKEGWHPKSFIVIDDRGHVINGKRRLAAAADAGVTPPADCYLQFTYNSNEDRLLHAWTLNSDPTKAYWAPNDLEYTRERLESLGIDLNREAHCQQVSAPREDSLTTASPVTKLDITPVPDSTKEEQPISVDNVMRLTAAEWIAILEQKAPKDTFLTIDAIRKIFSGGGEPKKLQVQSPPLTREEQRQMLAYLNEGKSDKLIAELMKKRYSQISNYIYRMIKEKKRWVRNANGDYYDTRESADDRSVRRLG